ncbi:MAG: DUF5721 family protein [Lachnospiraceae bacterium]|nr:DUF5721 family protein [Lachnospiraceae bacterium]
MRSFTVKNPKKFMSALLAGDVFDDFLLCEALIKTYNTFSIDGRIIPEYFDDYEFGYEYSSWKDIRPICFELIKGKILPVSFLFVMQLKPDKAKEIMLEEVSSSSIEQIKGLTLNIKYQNGTITVVTATSLNSFIPDKAPDNVWDSYMSDFLKLRYDFVD